MQKGTWTDSEFLGCRIKVEDMQGRSILVPGVRVGRGSDIDWTKEAQGWHETDAWEQRGGGYGGLRRVGKSTE